PGGVAARDHGRAARRAGAGQQALAHPRAAGRGRGGRPHGGPPRDARVRAPGRGQRRPGRRRPAGRLCARAAEQGEPDPLQPGARPAVEAPDPGRHRRVRPAALPARARRDRAPDAGRRELGGLRAARGPEPGVVSRASMKSSLRTRLFIALLALALVPTLVFAWFTLVQLHAATERWYQSGVEHALGAAIETNRTTLTRVEA